MSHITTISRDGLVARIDSMGAQLMGLSLDGREYLWQADPAWWGKTSPVLFPFVGVQGFDTLKSAAGPCAGARHGFARDFEHAVVKIADDSSSVTFELRDDERTRELYPYPFKLNMTYALTGPATLTQTFTVTNTGDAPMPFSVGGHPAFNVPAPGGEGESFEDYELRFSRAWTADSPKIVGGGLLSYADPVHIVEDADAVGVSRKMFDFDTVVLRDVPDNMIEMVGRKSGRGVRVEFPGFDFLGIWSAKPDAPFVALEPWTGHAALDTDGDVLEEREGITILAPGAVDERSFSVTLL
ncbi:MAG: aldose 1-epimerase family protein [Collinsella sp.]|nr:aldose 1-epimerase family protein [Collinsella sp.]